MRTSGARIASTFLPPTSRRSPATGSGVAHCPTSNLRLGAGVAPVRDLLDAGVRVGLGVDGSASNERGDLFLEVKQALLVARGRGGPRALTARDALRLGTRGGAAVLGRSDIGQLAPGLPRRLRRLAHRRALALRRGRSGCRARPRRPSPGRSARRRRRRGRPRRPADRAPTRARSRGRTSSSHAGSRRDRRDAPPRPFTSSRGEA